MGTRETRWKPHPPRMDSEWSGALCKRMVSPPDRQEAGAGTRGLEDVWREGPSCWQWSTPDSGILGDGSPQHALESTAASEPAVRHVGPPAGTPSTLSEHGPLLFPVRPPAVVSSRYRGSGCSEPLCRRWLQDRVERFLASSTAEAMDPSKIGFPALLQFYCLETACSYCRSRGNRFLALSSVGYLQ